MTKKVSDRRRFGVDNLILALKRRIPRPIKTAVEPVRKAIAPAKTAVGYKVANIWRSCLFRTRFIAITGSAGKTTCKECLAQLLASRGPVYKTPDSDNAITARKLFACRPKHRFAILETGTDRPGLMLRHSRIAEPDVVVILGVGHNHLSSFGSVEAITAEKSDLLKHMKSNGTAVLNGDDERVASMASMAPGKVIFFGSAQTHDVRVHDVTFNWTDGLRFRITARGESVAFRSRLNGTHWAPSLTGTIAAALSCGMSLSEMRDGIEEFEPFTGRLEMVPLPNGSTILRDDFSASMDTIQPALDLLRQAPGRRRILVFTNCSDMELNERQRLRKLAGAIAVSCDEAILIGRYSEYGGRRLVEAGFRRESVHTFHYLQWASDFLREFLQPGDVILLKGRTTDHVTRLLFAQLGSVSCWQNSCRKLILCDHCPELGFEAADSAAKIVSQDPE